MGNENGVAHKFFLAANCCARTGFSALLEAEGHVSSRLEVARSVSCVINDCRDIPAAAESCLNVFWGCSSFTRATPLLRVRLRFPNQRHLFALRFLSTEECFEELSERPVVLRRRVCAADVSAFAFVAHVSLKLRMLVSVS